MAAKRGNPTARGVVDTTGMDPEMISTLGTSSTLGKQAAAVTSKKSKKSADAASDSTLSAMYDRVDKARAVKGKPALPKPGTKGYRQ